MAHRWLMCGSVTWAVHTWGHSDVVNEHHVQAGWGGDKNPDLKNPERFEKIRPHMLSDQEFYFQFFAKIKKLILKASRRSTLSGSSVSLIHWSQSTIIFNNIAVGVLHKPQTIVSVGFLVGLSGHLLRLILSGSEWEGLCKHIISR